MEQLVRSELEFQLGAAGTAVVGGDTIIITTTTTIILDGIMEAVAIGEMHIPIDVHFGSSRGNRVSAYGGSTTTRRSSYVNGGQTVRRSGAAATGQVRRGSTDTNRRVVGTRSSAATRFQRYSLQCYAFRGMPLRVDALLILVQVVHVVVLMGVVVLL